MATFCFVADLVCFGVFDYSRTFFFLASVAPYLGYAFVKGFKGFGFYFIGIVIVITMQLLFSVQLSIRDYGLFESLNLNLEILNFSYKQDDSFTGYYPL